MKNTQLKKNFNEFINKINNIYKENKEDVTIGIMAIIVLLIGSFIIGFIKTFAIILLLYIILYRKKITNYIKIKYIKYKGTNNAKDDIVKKVKKMEKNHNTKKKFNTKKLLKILLLIFIISIIIGMILVAGFFYMIIKEAPKFDPDKLYSKESTVIYDKNGEIIAKLGTEKREKISYDEMSEVLVDAIIATEDSRFFQHNGFDLPRFLKASVGQLLGKDAGGASTLTMQVAKNNFNGTVSTGFAGIKRKFTDIYMAIFQLEKHYTKEQILEFYANSYFMGAGAWGVEQASLTYFGKNASELNLAEASLIAGLFQSPNSYNPYTNPELATERRSTVLYLMERHGYITAEERKAANAVSVESLLTKDATSSSEYMGFINTVVSEIIKDTGDDPYTTPMEIYSTMDKDKQNYINNLMNNGAFKWENEVVQAGVAVVDTKTGAVVAIGNGRNQNAAKSFNYATDIKNQIGSTAKPLYDYAPAIEFNSWNTYTPLIDEEHSYSSGNVLNNWDGKYLGFMTLRTALIESRNVPALKTFQQISNAKIKSFVTSLGLHPEIEDGIVHEAHSIGGYNGESPLSMAAAYAAFGNGGYYTDPYSYTKIIYRESNKTFEQKAQKNKVMSEETAYIICNMLVDTAKNALGRYSNVNGIQYGAKTGTTNFPDEAFKNFNLPRSAINDLWVASTNKDYSIAIWYGYDKINPSYVTKFGNTQHAQLFQAVAKGMYSDNSGFTKPNNVIAVEIENESYPNALLPSEFTPSDKRITELFIKGTEPTETSKRYSKLNNVTNVNGKLGENSVTLTWDKIATPDAIDTTYLTNYFKNMYVKAENQNKALNQRIAYNNSYIGTLNYRIYTKSSNGTLTYIGSTSDNTYTYELTTNSPITFVIKSAYTIFTSNMSDGTTFTFTPTGMESVVSIELNGDDTINLKIGDKYSEPDLKVIVLENLTDVSSKATVTTTVKRNSDGKSGTLTEIPILTDKAETYIITYKVKYGTTSDTLTKKIIIS